MGKLQLKTLRDYVEWYIAQGFNIFPVIPGTKGGFLGKWKRFETYKQTPEEIRKAFEPYYESGNVNIAMFMGLTSQNSIGVDFDGVKLHQKMKLHMPETMVTQTGSGKGFHYVYLLDAPAKTDRHTYVNENLQPRKRKIGKEDHIDIQGQGSIIILPPSVHPSGGQYKFVNLRPPAYWPGPFDETFRSLMDREFKIKEERREINIKRLMLGQFSKGECRPIREFEYLTWLRKNKVSADDALETIGEWNETNDPPINEEKLVAQWEWVYTHDLYNLKFTEKDVKVFSKEILEQAKKILVDPSLEDWTQKTLDEKIYREYKNRLVAFYTLLTGRMKGGKYKQILLIRGDPGGGKTHLANSLSKLFITLKRGRFSERAIDYMQQKIREHEILYLMEMIGMEGEQKGVSTLKFLSADDQGYMVEIYGKDADGKPTTFEFRIPPITVLTTSISMQIEKQFARRSLSLDVDDSLEQTMGILAFKSRKEQNDILEFIGIKNENQRIPTLEAMITFLKSAEIGIFFTNAIIKLFEGAPSLPLRIRGDYDKLLSLVKMRAFFYQYQRPFIKVGRKKIIFALPDDLLGVLQFSDETILEMTSGLEKRLRDAIPTIYGLGGKIVEISANEVAQGFTLNDFRNAYCPKKSYNHAKRILDGLADAGILSVSKYGKFINVYEINLSKSETEKLTVSIAKSKSASLIESLAEKEFRTKLSEACQLAKEANKADFKIYYPKGLKENSKFFRSLVSVATKQAYVLKEIQPDFENKQAKLANSEMAKQDD